MIYQIPDEPGMVRETLTLLPDKTLEDFEALPEGTLAQLINGELVMSPSPLVIHQLIVGELFHALKSHVQSSESGYVFVSPLDVELSPENIFQPDVLFVSYDRSSVITEKRIVGAPDLVVEVLSRSTGYYDLTIKKNVYAEYGVREYWIVDSQTKEVQVLINGEGGFMPYLELTSEGIIRSTILKELEIDVERLFAQP